MTPEPDGEEPEATWWQAWLLIVFLSGVFLLIQPCDPQDYLLK